MVGGGASLDDRLSRRDRRFESGSLQRGVWCEPDFRGRIPSMTVGDFADDDRDIAIVLGVPNGDGRRAAPWLRTKS
jgi:hypothetical protein